MAHQSIRELRAQIKRQLLAPEHRFVAAKLEVREPNGTVCFVVGGRWDCIAHRFVDQECDAHVVTLQESQVPAARCVRVWLAQRNANDILRAALLMLIGNRGGGKTHFCGLLMVVFALAFPGRAQIGVSITSKQNRELRMAIAKVAPERWIREDHTDPRDAYTQFVTLSTVFWLTARNPNAMRMALLNFELVVINEAQDQPEKVYGNALHAVRSGGLCVPATNPPQEDSGDWVAKVYFGLEAGETVRLEAEDGTPVDRDGVVFILEAKDNKAVDQPTLGKIDRLHRLANPEAADADSTGIIKLSGLVGYPGFTKVRRQVDGAGRWVKGHIGDPEPIDLGPRGRGAELLYRYGLKDVTRELTAALMKSQFGVEYVAGGDFQTEPGSCAPVGKLFRLPYMTPAGNLLLWIKEFVTTRGTEPDLTIALNEAGYYPSSVDYEGNPANSCLIVGDATGARQGAEHRKRDPYSFTRLRADGWRVFPPALYGPQRTPWNPFIPNSRKQMKALALCGLVMLSPACLEKPDGFPPLADSFLWAKVTPDGKFIKKGHHTHGPDGVRYLAWRFLWRPRPAKPTSTTLGEDFDALSLVKPSFES